MATRFIDLRTLAADADAKGFITEATLFIDRAMTRARAARTAKERQGAVRNAEVLVRGLVAHRCFLRGFPRARDIPEDEVRLHVLYTGHRVRQERGHPRR